MKSKIPVQLGQKYEIKITGMGQSGEGVGRFENFTVFIPYALPGETVEAMTVVLASFNIILMKLNSMLKNKK